ncbi:MAG: hypothetical protein ACMXYF_05210 [Candidatus Woesearchaeota archaeon]
MSLAKKLDTYLCDAGIYSFDRGQSRHLRTQTLQAITNTLKSRASYKNRLSNVHTYLQTQLKKVKNHKDEFRIYRDISQLLTVAKKHIGRDELFEPLFSTLEPRMQTFFDKYTPNPTEPGHASRRSYSPSYREKTYTQASGEKATAKQQKQPAVQKESPSVIPFVHKEVPKRTELLSVTDTPTKPGETPREKYSPTPRTNRFQSSRVPFARHQDLYPQKRAEHRIEPEQSCPYTTRNNLQEPFKPLEKIVCKADGKKRIVADRDQGEGFVLDVTAGKHPKWVEYFNSYHEGNSRQAANYASSAYWRWKKWQKFRRALGLSHELKTLRPKKTKPPKPKRTLPKITIGKRTKLALGAAAGLSLAALGANYTAPHIQGYLAQQQEARVAKQVQETKQAKVPKPASSIDNIVSKSYEFNPEHLTISRSAIRMQTEFDTSLESAYQSFTRDLLNGRTNATQLLGKIDLDSQSLQSRMYYHVLPEVKKQVKENLGKPFDQVFEDELREVRKRFVLTYALELSETLGFDSLTPANLHHYMDEKRRRHFQIDDLNDLVRWAVLTKFSDNDYFYLDRSFDPMGLDRVIDFSNDTFLENLLTPIKERPPLVFR